MTSQLNEPQLDALGELANIATGGAATALSQLVGREIDLSVPRALALPPADAVDACGPAEQRVAGVLVDVHGDVPAIALLLLGEDEARTLCELLGVDAAGDLANSALGEIGNILVAAYLGGLGAMTGLELLPGVPTLSVDMLGAIVATLLAETAGAEDLALVLEASLAVSGAVCSISFLLFPVAGGISSLLVPLGLAEVD